MTKQSGKPDPERSLSPSNDTSRIAAGLRSLEGDRGVPSSAAPIPASLSAAAVEAVIEARAKRSAHLPFELFGDPAWDMLLELMHAEITHRRITLPILCKAAGVQPGTGRRWVEALARKGLCTELDYDPEHGTISLSDSGSRAMRAYFGALDVKRA